MDKGGFCHRVKCVFLRIRTAFGHMAVGRGITYHETESGIIRIQSKGRNPQTRKHLKRATKVKNKKTGNGWGGISLNHSHYLFKSAKAGTGGF